MLFRLSFHLRHQLPFSSAFFILFLSVSWKKKKALKARKSFRFLPFWPHRITDPNRAKGGEKKVSLENSFLLIEFLSKLKSIIFMWLVEQKK